MLDKIHEEWKDILRPLFKDPRFVPTMEMLKSNADISPERDKIFRAFEHPLNKLRCVIVGQDPYPDKRIATGLAFAIPQISDTNRWPQSLRIIAESIQPRYPSSPWELYFSETLEYWEFQGVLLLNRYLTCENGKPGSHEHLWDWFTKELLLKIDQAKPGLVYYLLGSKAKEVAPILVNAKKVFDDVHPSYVARMRKEGKEFSMQGHWKEITDLTYTEKLHGIMWWLPF